MRKLLLLAAAVALLTTACRAEANFILDVDETGAGVVTAEVGIDDELMEVLDSVGGGTDQLFLQLPEGTDVEERREGDMTFYASTESFGDTAELEEQLVLFEEADTVFEDLELVIDDGAAVLNATVSTPDASEAVDGLGDFGDIGLDEIFTSSLYVSLPGELVESSADEVLADGRLRWEIPISGGIVEVMAVTESESGGVGMGLIIGIALVLVIVAAAALWVQNRRKASEDAISSAPIPGDPNPVIDPPDTPDGDAVIK